MQDYTEELGTAIQAAKLAAKHATTIYSEQSIDYSSKGSERDPVTKADTECERIIRETILTKFPNANILGEEQGGSLDNSEGWIIDPIDGTQYFVRHIPLWGHLIAYISNERPVVGVSYLPLMNELIYASLGNGAFCNEEKIYVSTIDQVKNSIFNHSSIRHITDRLPGFLRLSEMCLQMRGIGDAYGFHLVAQGKTEGMIDGHMSPWDAAARMIILEEAGAKATNYYGKPWSLKENNCIVTNGLIHDETMKILGQIS